jgi:hypothetical protein
MSIFCGIFIIKNYPSSSFSAIYFSKRYNI